MNPRKDDTEARESRVLGLRSRLGRVADPGKADYPAALCFVCGRPVAAGTGHRAGDGGDDPGARGAARAADAARAKRGRLPIDGWGRSHSACWDGGGPDELAAAQVRILARILGVEVPRPDARHVWDEFRDVLTAQARFPVVALTGHVRQDVDRIRSPFDWIDRATRKRMHARLAELAATRGSNRCQDGACALCGRAESIRWVESPFIWSDGAPAPICAGCLPVWERAGEPSSLTVRRNDTMPNVRDVCVKLATGYAVFPMPDVDLRPFFEVATPDERGGYPDPWTYRPGIATIQRDVWKVRPELIPDDRPELRAEIEAELTAEHVARRAARERELNAVEEPWTVSR